MKVTLVEYANGMFSVRKTGGLFNRDVSYYDFIDRKWRAMNYGYLNNCFTDNLLLAEKAYVQSGYSAGTEFHSNKLITLKDMSGMNQLAQTDLGMKDLLDKAKEYYYLKKK